jgi:outer membrane lipoprotein SlyB
MSAVTTHPATATAPVPASSLAAVPRAIWITLGTLAIATAGLGGALVMRAIDSPEPTSAQVAMQNTPARVGSFEQQAPAPVAAPVQQLQADEAAKPAPVAQQPKPAKPVVVQKPQPVRQASGNATQPAPQVVAQAPAQPAYTPVQTQRAAVCASCGTVEYVQEVKEKGPSTGLGAVGGAVVGGLLGHQVGGGNGKKVMTVVGAAGGALAGHEAEKHVRATSAYDVQVRMEDGSVRTFRRAEPVAVGSRVTVDGSTLRVRGQSGGGGIPARTIQTSAPAYGS